MRSVIRSDLDIYRHNKRRDREGGLARLFLSLPSSFLRFGNKIFPVFFFLFFISHMAFVCIWIDIQGLRRDKSPIHADRIHVHKSREEEKQKFIQRGKKIGAPYFYSSAVLWGICQM